MKRFARSFLLFALVGWQVAVTYLAFGLTIAIVSGLILGKLHLEGWLQPWVRNVRMDVTALPDRRLVAFPGGFVQQHLLIAEFANGKVLELPACIVCAVSGGRITRLDEYFDSKPLERLAG